MKAGYKTTEFWIVVAVIGYAFALATGFLKPGHISQAAQNIKDGTEAMPSLADAIKTLFEKYSEMAVMAGLAWAYLKKRSKEKIAIASQIRPPDSSEVIDAVKTAIKQMAEAKKKSGLPPPDPSLSDKY